MAVADAVRVSERERNKIDPLEERPRKRPNKKAFKRVRERVRVPILLPSSEELGIRGGRPRPREGGKEEEK